MVERANDWIERVDADGVGLFVQCNWQLDRYRHLIGIQNNGVRIPVLESSEGSPDEAWPPSPPLQQILTQSIDGDPALLAIGMAGAGHWSTSFVLQQKNSLELVIETACLIQPKVSTTTQPAAPQQVFKNAVAEPHACLDSDAEFDTQRIQSRLRTTYDLKVQQPICESSRQSTNVLRLRVPIPGNNSIWATISISGDRIIHRQDKLMIEAEERASSKATRWTCRIALEVFV